ncbi:hypothetical protein [Pseudomonas rhizophila]
MSDKIREEFEAWHGDQYGYFRLDVPHCQLRWEAWQASREAMVIELPPVPEIPEEPEDAIDDSHMDVYHSSVGMRHACSKFIEAAGLKVKS